MTALTLEKALRANHQKFGKRPCVGELLMRIQSEQKFPEDDPIEVRKQKQRIRRLIRIRNEMIEKLMDGGR